MINVIEKPHSSRPRKHILPVFILTEICEENDEGAVKVSLPNIDFYHRPKKTYTGQRFDNKPLWVSSKFNLYPVVINSSGEPWQEANLYILARLENALNPSMVTYDAIADDLVAYQKFIEEDEVDWRYFPAQKLARPTYRYSSHLKRLIRNGTVAASSAKRRLSSVLAFYSWMTSEGILVPLFPPWKESDVFLNLTDAHGIGYSMQVTSTDISIKVPQQNDPYDGRIEDGGKLRPLPLIEQQWVLEALCNQDNTEMSLIHLLALLTGARIQTVLTIKVLHIHKLMQTLTNADESIEIRCPIGMGTGIDNKRGKRMSLHIPSWLCSALFTYANSERARIRRRLAKNGDIQDQYLFLSKYGTPFYSSKADNDQFDPTSDSRYPIKGQSVRKFMSEVVIPYIRSKYDGSFHYQFHDLRATFGMNLTDSQLILVEQKKRTLHQVREYVKVRMGHESAATTDKYLQFRGNLTHILDVIDGHDKFLKELMLSVVKF